jgi:hypothetical protein
MMRQSPFSPLVVAVTALILVAVAVLAGRRLYRGDDSLLRDVSAGHEHISPNADGDQDVTPFAYELSQNATVSIYFESGAGTRFYFRREQPRGAGEYRVLFSGVVEGYTLPEEEAEGEILARLLQNGPYTWTVEATGGDGRVERLTGRLTIADADVELPTMRNFTLDREIFTPNRDGISDRVKARLYLAKQASVRVFLLAADGQEYPISELERDVPADTPGWHEFDYEGGVDNNAAPPPDGDYTIVAVAEDAEGQRVRQTGRLTIQYGGVPRGEIFPPPIGDTLELNKSAIPLCDTLFFTVTVENYGTTPIRTTGPAPGTVYDAEWNYNTLGWETESGAWRLAIGYETETKNYQYRWAIGDAATLEEIDGHLYLMPGQRAVVSGGIRVTGSLGQRNPQLLWAGLIHEDVEIATVNDHVDPHLVTIELPDEANMFSCEPRAVPVRPDE